MVEISKLVEIIFVEKLIIAGITGGIFVAGGLCLSLFFLWVGISKA